MKEEKEKSNKVINNVSLSKHDLELYQYGLCDLSSYKSKLAEKREKFMEENKDLIENIKHLSEILDNERNQFSDLAFKEYEHTGNKKLIGGLGIRIGTNLNYDTKTALNWATEHNMCLTLDKKNFEKIAKTQEIDFVKKDEVISVTFPKEIKFDEVD